VILGTYKLHKATDGMVLIILLINNTQHADIFSVSGIEQRYF